MTSGTSWASAALCTQYRQHADAWFAKAGTRRAEWAQGKCQQCPVMAQCLNGAMARGEQAGIWGGLHVEERQGLGMILARMNAAAAAQAA